MEDSTKNKEFWQGLWKDNLNFWHKAEKHPDLFNNFDKLTLDESNYDKTILFPLCGKTIDMAYCIQERKMNVIGIELVEQCIKEFFSENELMSYNVNEVKDAQIYEYVQDNTNLKIIKGDLFNTPELVTDGKVQLADFCFDRGALTAMNPELRKKYVNTIMKLLKPRAKILLNCFYYDLKYQNGPPHSVSEDNVRELYEPLGCKVTVISCYEQTFKQVTPALYKLYLVERE
ncbi:S-adenosyl-L-methionine-dependent methyltransferase [Neoconidiobolus thromboides FSU 785]|nr:S-adenosyl-L-methionine-dependent methyltransferase [Neoconidiobolus thromboides FSU 785]